MSDEAAQRRAEAWVATFERAWETGETDLLLEVVDPDASILYPLMEEPVDREGLRMYFAAGHAAVPDFRIRLLRWARSGDDVFMEWEGRGTVNGETITWGGLDRFTFSGDRIVEARAYGDPRPLIAALEAQAAGATTS